MFKHILVPLDGSPFAESALPMARTLASHFGASITLVQVVAITDTLSIESVELLLETRDLALQHAEAYLAEKQQALRAEGFNVDYLVVERDGAADGIIDLANHRRHDLIVMSSHGRSGIKRWLLGSVAERVIRASEIPVLLSRQQDNDETTEEHHVAVSKQPA